MEGIVERLEGRFVPGSDLCAILVGKGFSLIVVEGDKGRSYVRDSGGERSFLPGFLEQRAVGK